MCEPITLGTIALLGGGIGAIGAYAQGQSEKNAANRNAEISDIAAKDSIERGEQQAQKIRMEGSQVASAAKSAAVVSGVDPTTGSAANLIATSQGLSEYDAQLARNNAAREAWGYKVQAKDYRAAAKNAETQSILRMGSSLLGGAGSAAQIASPKISSAYSEYDRNRSIGRIK